MAIAQRSKESNMDNIISAEEPTKANLEEDQGNAEAQITATPEWKAPATQEEFEQSIQAAVNKANTKLLKEIGGSSAKEIREKLDSYNTLLESKLDIENKLTEANKTIETMRKEKLITDLGISEENKDDVFTLAESKVSESCTIEEALKEVIQKYPQFLGTNRVILGSDKADNTNLNAKTVEEKKQDLRKLFGLK